VSDWKIFHFFFSNVFMTIVWDYLMIKANFIAVLWSMKWKEAKELVPARGAFLQHTSCAAWGMLEVLVLAFPWGKKNGLDLPLYDSVISSSFFHVSSAVLISWSD